MSLRHCQVNCTNCVSTYDVVFLTTKARTAPVACPFCAFMPTELVRFEDTPISDDEPTLVVPHKLEL